MLPVRSPCTTPGSRPSRSSASCAPGYARPRRRTSLFQLRHRGGERVLERVDDAVVGRDSRLLQQVDRDLEVRPARERDELLGRRAGHALERDQERVAPELRRVDQRAVDVPQNERAQIQAADSKAAIFRRRGGLPR